MTCSSPVSSHVGKLGILVDLREAADAAPSSSCTRADGPTVGIYAQNTASHNVNQVGEAI